MGGLFRMRRWFPRVLSRLLGRTCNLQSSPISRFTPRSSTPCGSSRCKGINIDKVRYISQTPFERTVLLDTDGFLNLG
jgi:hypothetical protein